MLTGLAILDTLVPFRDEVDLIFDYPVKIFLDPTLVAGENLVLMGSERWMWESEYRVRQKISFQISRGVVKGTLWDFLDSIPGSIVGCG